MPSAIPRLAHLVRHGRVQNSDIVTLSRSTTLRTQILFRMSIQLKIACTPKEIDDALWLRHEVYVKEEGKYGGRSWPDERMVDRFDALPRVAHIIAYDADQPVATLRVNSDMGLGLPPEKHFDFKPYSQPPQ
jgi:hypothetical protein